MWEHDWVYVASWELIFFLAVLAMLFIWKINENSLLLAHTEQIDLDEDARLSGEELRAIELPILK